MFITRQTRVFKVVKEYHDLKKNPNWKEGKPVPMLSPANSIGEIYISNDDGVTIPSDQFDVTYGRSHYPIDDENLDRKNEQYRIK